MRNNEEFMGIITARLCKKLINQVGFSEVIAIINGFSPQQKQHLLKKLIEIDAIRAPLEENIKAQAQAQAEVIIQGGVLTLAQLDELL